MLIFVWLMIHHYIELNNTKSSSSDVVRKLEVHLYIHATKSLVRMDTDCHPI